MTQPYERPCHNGACTSTGMAEPGFCKCKADAERMEMLERALDILLIKIDVVFADDLPTPVKEAIEAARAALDYRPAQMKTTAAACKHEEFKYLKETTGEGVMGLCLNCYRRVTAWPGSVHYEKILAAKGREG